MPGPNSESCPQGAVLQGHTALALCLWEIDYTLDTIPHPDSSVLDVTETKVTKIHKIHSKCERGKGAALDITSPHSLCRRERQGQKGEVTSLMSRGCRADSIPGLLMGMLPVALIYLRSLSCWGITFPDGAQVVPLCKALCTGSVTGASGTRSLDK